MLIESTDVFMRKDIKLQKMVLNPRDLFLIYGRHHQRNIQTLLQSIGWPLVFSVDTRNEMNALKSRLASPLGPLITSEGTRIHNHRGF